MKLYYRYKIYKMFENGGLIYKFSKFDLETNEVYFIRGSWIARKNPLTNEEFKYWVNQSKFLYHIILYNCHYSCFEINDPLTLQHINIFSNPPPI
jgi:hypothetical protein